jgi:predicted nucleotidyltransferase
MRLTPEQIEVIRQSTEEVFGAHARVRLFGSRLDDQARGGDIDLLVESDQAIPEIPRKRLQLVARLQMRLGDQPIDVLICDAQSRPDQVHREAQQTGVRL